MPQAGLRDLQHPLFLDPANPRGTFSNARTVMPDSSPISRFTRSILALVLLLGSGAIASAQQIQVLWVNPGNVERVINNGDDTPSGGDGTNFGQVAAGAPPVDREFIIRNTSSVPLQLRAFQRLGNNPGNFTVIAPPDLLIPGNQQTAMTLRFIPPAVGGLRTATIRIVSTSSRDNDFLFGVSGELVLPAPNIEIFGNGIAIADGSSIPKVENLTDFETLDLQAPPRQHTFTIRNTGEVTLRISSVDVVGFNGDQYVVTSAPATFIPPSSETTFDISFNPTREGIHRATVNVNSNDPTPTETSYSFAVRGSGQAFFPSLVLSGNGMEILPGDDTPSPGDYTTFPNTDVESVSTRSFTLRNAGEGPLEIADLAIRGTHATEFTAARLSDAPIPAGGQDILHISFRPRVRGSRFATLRIISNDPDSPIFDVDLEGAGGRFRLLGIEIMDRDTLIEFDSNPARGSYIYDIFHSTDMEDWLKVGSLLSNPGETRLFRHRNSTSSRKGFYYIEERRLE
ncbi:MAG: hypothetical protein CMO40_07285 [Verrucomicrobiaceae bacterium]|nr:hypothetical protein [Verrucomicrobiaceae bacterium]